MNPFAIKIPELNLTEEQRLELRSYYQSIEQFDWGYADQHGRRDGNLVNTTFKPEDVPFVHRWQQDLAVPCAVYFLSQAPGSKILPHADEKRFSVINFPVTNVDEVPTDWYIDYNYDLPHESQPPVFQTRYRNETYLLNTLAWHGLDNRSAQKRLFLQFHLFDYYPKVAREYFKGRLFNSQSMRDS